MLEYYLLNSEPMHAFARMQLKLQTCNSGSRRAGFLRQRLRAEGSNAGDRPFGGNKELQRG